MNYIFGKSYDDVNDSELVKAAQEGSLSALEDLLVKHQSFIYNIALRMTGSIHDADDITQEIMIKIITRLSTFKGKSSYRTWLYRIVANHVLNMQQKQKEVVMSSFENHRSFLNSIPDRGPGRDYDCFGEKHILYEETRIQCLNGMLLCLDRKSRLVFILGAVFSIDSNTGGEILDISAVNYRKILSRARVRLHNYMNGNCSLVNKKASCHCSGKTAALIEAGYINPEKPELTSGYAEKVEDFISGISETADETYGIALDRIFREQPYLKPDDYIPKIKKILCRMKTAWDNNGLL